MNAKVKITDISLNIAEDDVSINIKESHTEFSPLTPIISIYPCLWGEAMFGEPCIFGAGIPAGSPAYMTRWGESSFGEVGILGIGGIASSVHSFTQLNVIRTQ